MIFLTINQSLKEKKKKRKKIVWNYYGEQLKHFLCPNSVLHSRTAVVLTDKHISP